MYKHKVAPNPRHLTRTPAERFWEKVNKDGPTPAHDPALGPCWLWTASVNVAGYGQFGIGGGNKHKKAHRVSYELANGPIPDELCVLHKCDNPPCVNPGHLYAGTQKDNGLDRAARGRTVAPHPRGEAQWQAKLTEEKVREIRRRCATRSPENRIVAEEMGITIYTIGDILRRKTWKHVV